MITLVLHDTLVPKLVLNKYSLNDCIQRIEEPSEGPVMWELGRERDIWAGGEIEQMMES